MGDITTGLTDMWRSILLFLPKALAFVAILVVGWIIARAVRKLVNAALERVGFDRAVQRGGIGRALERSRYDASDILASLAYFALLLLTLQLAFGVWGPNPVSDVITAIVAWLPRAFVAIVIVVVAAAIGSAVKDLITGALGGLSYGRFLANLASWFIIGLGVIAALNQVGIATTVTTPVLIAALATIAGILIVGVGGGLVRPMASRWDRWLDRAESESQVIKEKAHGYAAGREDMRRAAEQAEAERLAAEQTETERLAAERAADDRTVAIGDTAADSTLVMATSAGRQSAEAADVGAQNGHGGATTGQAPLPRSADEPGQRTHSGRTYESGHAAGGSVDDTQRIDPGKG